MPLAVAVMVAGLLAWVVWVLVGEAIPELGGGMPEPLSEASDDDTEPDMDFDGLGRLPFFGAYLCGAVAVVLMTLTRLYRACRRRLRRSRSATAERSGPSATDTATG